jgi:hypothetical protein
MCEICSKPFAERSYLKRHKRIAHQEPKANTEKPQTVVESEGAELKKV